MLTAKNSAGYAAPIGIAVDPVVFTVLDDRLHVLLVKRLEAPQKGRLSLPGGFLGDKEGSDETIGRKLEEKTGVREVYLEKLTFHAERGRDPRGWMPSLSYLALVAPGDLPHERPDGDARWSPVDDLGQLSFDHNTIVDEGVQRLRERAQDLRWLAQHGVDALGEEFTLAEALNLYKRLTSRAPGTYVDLPNFRRDLLATGLIEPAGGERRQGVGRPAKTFRRVQLEQTL
jgi:8-oxo-dGTP diphosphatase